MNEFKSSPRTPSWLTKAAAARKLGISNYLVSKLVSSGALAATTIGSRRLIHVNTIAQHDAQWKLG